MKFKNLLVVCMVVLVVVGSVQAQTSLEAVEKFLAEKGEHVLIGPFLKNFSDRIFFRAGEGGGFNLDYETDIEKIYAYIDPSLKVHNALAGEERVDNPFFDAVSLIVYKYGVDAEKKFQLLKIFFDDNFDGYPDRYRKTYKDPLIWFDQIPLAVQGTLQIEFNSCLQKLNKEAEKRIQDYYK